MNKKGKVKLLVRRMILTAKYTKVAQRAQFRIKLLTLGSLIQLFKKKPAL
jgi:hypothetical protein